MPEGTFSLVHGKSHAVGEALVKHTGIKAVGFTGSYGGGVKHCLNMTMPAQNLFLYLQKWEVPILC